MVPSDRKRYLVIQAIRYLQSHPDGDIFYDDADCDGACLADDMISEFDIELTEIREHSGLQARLKGRL